MQATSGIPRSALASIIIAITETHRSFSHVIDKTMERLQGFCKRLPLKDTLAAQERYVTSVADVMRQHDNVLGFDLGNELNCCWWDPERQNADQWHRHMLALARQCLPDGIHTNGVDHQPWFREATFSPQALATTQAIIPLHCWTYFTDALKRAGGNCLAPRSLRLPEAMAALARAYAGDPGQPVWIQEFGMSTDWTAQENIPRFLQESTRSAINAGVSCFTWWSSHDLDRQYDFNPLEDTLGLTTHDRKIKPSVMT